MNRTYEFGSREWLQTLFSAIRRRARAAGCEREFSMCEVFTDVPAHLGKDETGRLAWHCVVGDGAVECEEGEIEYADWKIVVDYSSILPITRLRFEDDASVAERMIQELIISGRMTVIGDRERLPGFLEGLHDEMADVTE